jgi:hypothetical protein
MLAIDYVNECLTSLDEATKSKVAMVLDSIEPQDTSSYFHDPLPYTSLQDLIEFCEANV